MKKSRKLHEKAKNQHHQRKKLYLRSKVCSSKRPKQKLNHKTMTEEIRKIMERDRQEKLERMRKRQAIYEESERKRRQVLGQSEKQIARELRDERISVFLQEYRQENLLGAGQMTTADWTEVYRNAGMSDEEIAAYREEMSKYAAALDDPLDAYRD